jgi:hypothetical protein
MKLNVGPVDTDEVLAVTGYGPGALIVLETSATSDGTYAAVTGPASTPSVAVVAGDRFYEMYDGNGASTSWYQIRYESADGLTFSDWSPPFQGTVQAPWFVTGGELLTHAGVDNPTPADTAWADACAAAVNGAIAWQLEGTTLSAWGAAELYRAALSDGVGAYLDRDAPHGVLSTGIDGSAVRLGADILRASVPVLRRHSLGYA